MWHARPLSDDDIADVVAMVNACEVVDSGEVTLEAADIVAELAHADRQRDACVVVQDGRIVAWGLIWDARNRWADVHPDARGQVIGGWLLKWAAWRAKHLGADRTGQTIDDRRPNVGAWLQANGYTPRYTSWVLSIPSAPMDHTARPAAEPDLVLNLFEQAYSELPDRAPVTLERWRAMTLQRSGFTAEDLLVVHREGEIAGAAFLIDADEIWVDNLAVSAGFRSQGVARELLAAAQARAAGAGYGRVRLSTDSETSALAMYEHLGMTVERSFTHWAIDL